MRLEVVNNLSNATFRFKGDKGHRIERLQCTNHTNLKLLQTYYNNKL